MVNRSAAPKSHSIEWLFYWLRPVGYFATVIALLLAVSGCGTADAPVKLGGATMGTTWSITYLGSGEEPPAAQINAGVVEVLAAVNASMSTYQPTSEISRFNALPAGEPIQVSEPFIEVLETALRVGGLTQGAYDVTVGPLVDLWGFGSATFGLNTDVSIPAASAIAKALAQVGQNRIVLDVARQSISKQGELALDFSSLAKGYAVDEVAAFLRENGITRYLIEVGGEMALAGNSPRGDLWQIAIEQPEPQMRSVAAALRLTDLAIATSGDYRNYVEIDGKRYSHAIDPRNGYPIDHELVSVTVVHESAMAADAWATALIVLGLDDALAVAQAQGLAVYCIAHKGGEFVHRHSKAIAAYIMPHSFENRLELGAN
ncbi:MAG: FAD:protein FMN transferase [Halioglobus sp.]